MQARIQYPNLLKLLLFLSLFLALQEKPFLSDSLHHSLQVGMFCIVDCFSGTGVNIGAFILEVAYGCSLCIEI